MTLDDLSKQVAIPLVVSLAMGVFSVLWNAGTQKTLLEQNIVATAELSKAVIELRLQMAVYGATFATKESLTQLEQRVLLAERNK